MTQLGVPRRYAAVFPNGASVPADHEFAAYLDSGGDRYRLPLCCDTVRKLRPSADHSLPATAGAGRFWRWELFNAPFSSIALIGSCY